MLRNIRLTPLTFIIAGSITYAFYCLLGFEKSVIISIYASFGYSIALAMILFIADLIFRKLIIPKKQLWIIESSFILLIFTLIIIFKK
jgi:hypothetical protein